MVELDGLEPIEEAHEFEVDLTCLVVANHKLTIEGIERDEDEESEKLSGILPGELEDSEQRRLHYFYEDLRKSANNLAAVALVTRIQHWIGRFVREIRANLDELGLVKSIDLLNAEFRECGPVPVRFFRDLVTLRDSVIHGDSRAKWNYRKAQRCVADTYVNCSLGTAEISDSQLTAAITNAIEQVKWYDEKLQARKTPRS